MHNTVDVVVIGAGLAGSATAWALAQRGCDVMLVGPGEPADIKIHHGVFASHYDEGRITRIADRDPVWAGLAARSIAKYRALEELTGIAFYTPAGLLILGPREGQYLRETEATAGRCGSRLERLTGDAVMTRFPGLSCPEGRAGLHEATPAGHINPRRLVEALKSAARQSGCSVVEAAVATVERDQDTVRLKLDDGGIITARRALLATGAFTLEPELVPDLPWLGVEGRTIVMFEVAEDDAAMRALPSLVHMVNEDGVHETLYAVPPLRYPDGRIYLKAGTGLLPSRIRASGDDNAGSIGRWFRGEGSMAEVDMIKKEVWRLLPGLRPAATLTATCAITYTRTGRPYIAMMDERVGIVLGCNGVAAKSCIAIGDHAADMVEGRLDGDLADAFALSR